MEMREIADWAAVVSFEVPDSDGQLAQLYYSRTDERLQEFRLGAELYHVEYNSDGDFLDVMAEEPEGRRLLQSEEQQEDYHLPAWLNPEALEGAAEDRIDCPTCQNMVDVACRGVDVTCKMAVRNLPVPLNMLLFIACKGVDLICILDLLDTPVCTDYFCCGRSKCRDYFAPGGGECYDELQEQCCDDGSVIDAFGCCPGLEMCGEFFINIFDISSCFDPDVQKCCPATETATETWPSLAVGISECCPSQVRLCVGIQLASNDCRIPCSPASRPIYLVPGVLSCGRGTRSVRATAHQSQTLERYEVVLDFSFGGSGNSLARGRTRIRRTPFG